MRSVNGVMNVKGVMGVMNVMGVMGVICNCRRATFTKPSEV